MPIIALTTTSGAPGCTTTALGLALTWAGPTLLVEADPAGSAVSAGYFRGTVDHSRGLLNLALGGGSGDLPAAILAESRILDADADRRILLGLAEAAQATALEAWWGQIGQALRQVAEAGYTVIIDAGRIAQSAFPRPLVEAADIVLVVCRATLSSAVRTQSPAAELRDAFARQGRDDTVGLAVVGTADYQPGEVARALDLPLLLRLPEDARHARVLSDGATERRFPTSSLARAYRDGSRTLASRIEQRRRGLRSGRAELTDPVGARP